MDVALPIIGLWRGVAFVASVADLPHRARPLGEIGPLGWLTLLGVVTIGASTGGVLWALLQLWGQYERLLARLDRLDATLAGRRPRARPEPSGAAAARDDADDDEDDEGEALPVPPIGSPAPAVRLPDLDGAVVDVPERRGAPTLLLFWDPDCGFCRQLRPAIKRWEADPPPGAPTLVVISDGSAEANKAEGFRSRVLIDADFAVSASFGADATPTAIVIDGEGRVASGLASGQEEVLALLGDRGAASGARDDAKRAE